MASLARYVSLLKGFGEEPLKIPALSAAYTHTRELSKVEVFPNMGQRPAGAFHPGVLAGPALLMEHAFERAGIDILGYEVAEHLICGRDCAVKDGSALGT